LPSENQSVLRFSIEESVWFQKGQEVEELVSISIDPDIMIQEYEQYVTIRGALLLTGEYRIDEEGHEAVDDREFTTVRLVQDVTTREDGISELKHRFPVDITIPKNRIQSLDDIYVSIESFDYELPEKHHLQLIADLSISGIYGNQQSVPKVGAEEEDEIFARNESEYGIEEQNSIDMENNDFHEGAYEENEEDTDLFSPFEAVARREVYHEDLYELPEKEESSPQIELKGRSEAKEKEVLQEETNPQVELKGRNEEKETVRVHQEKQYTDQLSQEKVELYHHIDNDKKYEYHNAGFETESKSDAHSDGMEHDRTEEETSMKRDENALYLTKIFTKEKEEDFSKLKMCIVQQGESIENIAQRYEISVQQLLRMNNLTNEHDVTVGQILYIPIPASSNR
jgi:stage VI sporulation protein D